MEGLKIVKTQITREACCNILDTAIDAGHTHGFGYWAELIKVHSEKTSEPGDGPSTRRTVAITLLDRDMEGKHGAEKKITAKMIAKAINAILTDPEGTDAVGWSKALLTDDYSDGPLAEAIIQIAFHGKVIYG